MASVTTGMVDMALLQLVSISTVVLSISTVNSGWRQTPLVIGLYFSGLWSLLKMYDGGPVLAALTM